MRRDASQNRERILLAARELVAQHGDRVRMDDLAARAGVAVGTLYRHFPTKTDLVRAVVDERVAEIADLAERAHDRVLAGAPAWEELTSFWAGISAGAHAGRSARLAADLLGVAAAPPVPPVAPPAGGEATARALAAMQAMLERTRDDGQMRTDITLGDLFLLLIQAPDRDDPARRERYLEIVIAGLRPPAAQPRGRSRPAGRAARP